MKLLSLFLMVLPSWLFAQQIVTEVGRNSMRFDYHNSQGERLEGLYPKAHLSFAFGFRKDLTQRLHATAQLLFEHYGSEGSIESLNTRMVWDMEYVGLGLALDGELYRRKGLVLLVRAAAEPQMMIKGTQTINDRIYDLRGVEQFEHPFLFLRGGAGMNYCLDERSAITLRYMYGYGLPMGNATDGESLRLLTSTVSVGLLWNLSRCRYCSNMR